MKVKAGYKTSEFWFTMVSFVFSGLYLMGIIGDFSQKEELISNISHGVESTILIGGQLLVLYRYVKGRSDVKKLVEQEHLEELKNSKSPTKSSTTTKKPTTVKKTTSKKPTTKKSTKPK